MKTLNDIETRIELRNKTPIIILYFAVPVLFFFAIFSYRTYADTKDKALVLETDVQKLENRKYLIEQNKFILKDKLDLYNAYLSQLVPEKEDFFSIIFALEKLSQETGFVITRFTINITTSTAEKLSLTIEGDGDADTFLQFLQKYQFAGGRLITNEEIDFTPSDNGKIKLSLNFYSRPNIAQDNEAIAITRKDILLMEDIATKSVLLMKNKSGTGSYEIKANPF